MDKSDSFQTFSFRGTSTSRDAPNPLRPYYIPPSIGLPPSDAPASGNTSGRSSFPAAARELFSDIDYEQYIPDRSTGSSGGGDGDGIVDMVRRIADQAIWNYTSVLLAQPFEVAKVVLQCYQADAIAQIPQTPSRGVHTPGRNGYSNEPGVSLRSTCGCKETWDRRANHAGNSISIPRTTTQTQNYHHILQQRNLTRHLHRLRTDGEENRLHDRYLRRLRHRHTRNQAHHLTHHMF